MGWQGQAQAGMGLGSLEALLLLSRVRPRLGSLGGAWAALSIAPQLSQLQLTLGKA